MQKGWTKMLCYFLFILFFNFSFLELQFSDGAVLCQISMQPPPTHALDFPNILSNIVLDIKWKNTKLLAQTSQLMV